MLTRRDLLRAAGATLGSSCVAGARLSPANDPSPLAIPGLFPARVIGVQHSGSLAEGGYYGPVISRMFQAGMRELAGVADWQDAWRLFFEPGDVVGVKVNPASYPYIVSSREVLWEIVQGLEAGGVKRNDIVVYDRYSVEFAGAGMQSWLPPGVRTMFASREWDDTQQSMDGYDPDHYMDLGYGLPGQDTSNPAVRRSYAALFITKAVNKLVNLALLKDHQAAGVTLSLKNLSNGLVNNVNRSHPDPTRNYTGTFIPAAVSIPAIRTKAVLNILDGVRGLYHSGPHAKPQFLWDHHTLYFSTDPVALDRIGWKVIDDKRVSAGMQPVAEAPPDEFSVFLNRHPEHIELAGMAGLGEWRLDHIAYQHIQLDLNRPQARLRVGLPGTGRAR